MRYQPRCFAAYLVSVVSEPVVPVSIVVYPPEALVADTYSGALTGAEEAANT